MSNQIQRLLAENIKRARARKRLSQMALASRCGISPGYLAEIETCRKFPSADVLQSLADGLQCHPSILFSPTPEETKEEPPFSPVIIHEITQAKERIAGEIDTLVRQLKPRYRL